MASLLDSEPHVSPAPTVRTATQTWSVLVPLTLVRHVAPATQPPSGQASPTCFAGAHVPHPFPPLCADDPFLHWPLAHWVSSSHALPSASEPRTSSKSSSHASSPPQD